MSKILVNGKEMSANDLLNILTFDGEIDFDTLGAAMDYETLEAAMNSLGEPMNSLGEQSYTMIDLINRYMSLANKDIEVTV